MLQQSLQSATSAAISTQSATVAAQSAAGSRAVAAVATNVSALRASLQATLATVAGLRAAARRNVMCMADLVSGALPAHSEPVHGDCNLTTGGVCKVTCKTGYKANGAINHALNKPVVGDAGSQQTHFCPLERRGRQWQRPGSGTRLSGSIFFNFGKSWCIVISGCVDGIADKLLSIACGVLNAVVLVWEPTSRPRL